MTAAHGVCVSDMGAVGRVSSRAPDYRLAVAIA